MEFLWFGFILILVIFLEDDVCISGEGDCILWVAELEILGKIFGLAFGIEIIKLFVFKDCIGFFKRG